MGPRTYAASAPGGRAVVVKLAAGSDPSSLDRERAALVALARLRHPALVRLAGTLDDGADIGTDAIALEPVLGRSLDEHLATDGPLGLAAADRLLAPVAAALTAIHAEGWVHGDLSPANVVIGPEGAVLVDLGAAHPVGDAGARPTGTPGYTAPEVVAGSSTTTASDVWSLAAVLAAATGQIPRTPVDPAGRSELRPILRRALSPDPADRPGAATVQAALAPGGAAAAGNPQLAAAAVVLRRNIDCAAEAARRAAAPTLDYGPRPRPQVDPPDEWSGARDTAALVAVATVIASATLTFFGT